MYFEISTASHYIRKHLQYFYDDPIIYCCSNFEVKSHFIVIWVLCSSSDNTTKLNRIKALLHFWKITMCHPSQWNFYRQAIVPTIKLGVYLSSRQVNLLSFILILSLMGKNILLVSFSSIWMKWIFTKKRNVLPTKLSYRP